MALLADESSRRHAYGTNESLFDDDFSAQTLVHEKKRATKYNSRANTIYVLAAALGAAAVSFGVLIWGSDSQHIMPFLSAGRRQITLYTGCVPESALRWGQNMRFNNSPPHK